MLTHMRHFASDLFFAGHNSARGDKQQEIDAIAMWTPQLGHSTWAPARDDGTRARLELGRLGAR